GPAMNSAQNPELARARILTKLEVRIVETAMGETVASFATEGQASTRTRLRTIQSQSDERVLREIRNHLVDPR
ncbi:MAG: hypothetical protein R3282_08660, partial [Rhodothermales bacterium]|nr:hypothetical protein [Rhodothermales bacterium]